MALPLRLKFPGAVYHLAARDNARNAICINDEDRDMFLACLGKMVARCGWLCHAYCLMDNHYHLLVETPKDNLSRGMRQLNAGKGDKFIFKNKLLEEINLSPFPINIPPEGTVTDPRQPGPLPPASGASLSNPRTASSNLIFRVSCSHSVRLFLSIKTGQIIGYNPGQFIYSLP